MPITLPPTPGSPLQQGDILKGVSFAVALADGRLQSQPGAEFVIVVARPCKALRSTAITVAPVARFVFEVKGLRERMAEAAKEAARRSDPIAKQQPLADVDLLRRTLDTIRDGGTYSDKFYLGQLAGGDAHTRYAADLTTLSTVVLPKLGDERSKFIERTRVASLDGEFVRDLHLRVFNAFARLGFEDYRWLPDEDLALVIVEGEAEVNARHADVLADESSQLAGGTTNAKESKDVEARRKAHDKAVDTLAPFKAERERRKSEPPEPDERD